MRIAKLVFITITLVLASSNVFPLAVAILASNYDTCFGVELPRLKGQGHHYNRRHHYSLPGSWTRRQADYYSYDYEDSKPIYFDVCILAAIGLAFIGLGLLPSFLNKFAVNGGWSAFGPFSPCSATCGTSGTQTRTRTCTNPRPSRSGADCPGSNTDAETCSAGACPIDGAWSQWGDFGPCSVTCGTGGTQTRTRTCTNPPPSNGGKDCPGSNTSMQPCTQMAAPPACLTCNADAVMGIDIPGGSPFHNVASLSACQALCNVFFPACRFFAYYTAAVASLATVGDCHLYPTGTMFQTGPGNTGIVSANAGCPI